MYVMNVKTGLVHRADCTAQGKKVVEVDDLDFRATCARCFPSKPKKPKRLTPLERLQRELDSDSGQTVLVVERSDRDRHFYSIGRLGERFESLFKRYETECAMSEDSGNVIIGLMLEKSGFHFKIEDLEELSDVEPVYVPVKRVLPTIIKFREPTAEEVW